MNSFKQLMKEKEEITRQFMQAIYGRLKEPLFFNDNLKTLQRGNKTYAFLHSLGLRMEIKDKSKGRTKGKRSGERRGINFY